MAVRKPVVLINGEKQLLPDTDSVPNADKLDGKDSTEFATAVHTHMISDVTNLQTELDNKSNINHNHDDKYLGKTEKAADADKLDGNDSSYYATAADLTSHTTNTNNPHNVTAAQLGAANILNQIKTVDGAGSGLDADLLDGQHASYFAPASHNHDTQYLGKTDKAVDADKLDGHDSTYFATASSLSSHISNTSNPHNVTAAQLGASNILTQIKTVDGSGSGLDADTVDGIHASSFLRSDTGQMNLRGIAFAGSSGNRIIKSIGVINDAKAGVILFAKVYSGTFLPKQGFVGKLFVDRGTTGAFNFSYEYNVVCTTAYDNSILTLTGNHTNCYLVKVNYNGEDYYGVYSQVTSLRMIIIDGFIYDYNLDGNGNPYIVIPDASGYTVTKVDSTQIYINQDKIYSSKNIVGTVSQSGGVPTGAIIETGSNANGAYIKFADGTMIATNSNNPITTSPTTFVGTITKIDNDKLWIGRWY